MLAYEHIVVQILKMYYRYNPKIKVVAESSVGITENNTWDLYGSFVCLHTTTSRIAGNLVCKV